MIENAGPQHIQHASSESTESVEFDDGVCIVLIRSESQMKGEWVKASRVRSELTRSGKTLVPDTYLEYLMNHPECIPLQLRHILFMKDIHEEVEDDGWEDRYVRYMYRNEGGLWLEGVSLLVGKVDPDHGTACFDVGEDNPPRGFWSAVGDWIRSVFF